MTTPPKLVLPPPSEEEKQAAATAMGYTYPVRQTTFALLAARPLLAARLEKAIEKALLDAWVVRAFKPASETFWATLRNELEMP